MKKSMLKVLSVLGIFIALTMSITGCSRKSKIVTLAGSTAFQPFAEKLAEEFIKTNKGIHINVQGGGSAVGIQSAISGASQIGMADLPELPEEAKTLNATIVARDGIAIVVNPKNTIVDLTADQAKGIFSGKITNWKEVGGLDAEIRIVSREEGSGTRRTFDKIVLNGDSLCPKALFQNSNGTVREAVANDPNSIGYVSIGLVNDKVKAISYNGVLPQNAYVKSGSYPLARPVFFLTKGEITPETQLFIDYVLSDTAQKILESEGLIAAK